MKEVALAWISNRTREGLEGRIVAGLLEATRVKRGGWIREKCLGIIIFPKKLSVSPLVMPTGTTTSLNAAN